MKTATNRSIKLKVTVSLDADLVNRINEILPKGQSRSQLVQKALDCWIHEYTRQRIEEEVEQYYLSLSESEKEEDRKWGQIAAESAKGLWKK